MTPNPGNRKGSKVKARVMWHCPATDKRYPKSWAREEDGPVFVLPADPQSIEAMREQVAEAAYLARYPKTKHRNLVGPVERAQADAMLASLSLHSPQKQEKRK